MKNSFSFKKIEGMLSRDEMKKIVGGSGDAGKCGSGCDGACTNTCPDGTTSNGHCSIHGTHCYCTSAC